LFLTSRRGHIRGSTCFRRLSRDLISSLVPNALSNGNSFSSQSSHLALADLHSIHNSKREDPFQTREYHVISIDVIVQGLWQYYLIITKFRRILQQIMTYLVSHQMGRAFTPILTQCHLHASGGTPNSPVIFHRPSYLTEQLMG